MATMTAKQDKALAALLSEPTIAAAAAKVGVGERTIHTWLHEPAFGEAYRSARRDAVQQAIARLQQASGDAVTVLTELIDGIGGVPPTVRLAAAKAVLEHAIQGVMVDDLAARLEALEVAHAQR